MSLLTCEVCVVRKDIGIIMCLKFTVPSSSNVSPSSVQPMIEQLQPMLVSFSLTSSYVSTMSFMHPGLQGSYASGL